MHTELTSNQLAPINKRGTVNVPFIYNKLLTNDTYSISPISFNAKSDRYGISNLSPFVTLRIPITKSTKKIIESKPAIVSPIRGINPRK